MCPPKHAYHSYIELFAGVGGFKLGLDHVGGECVFASEIDSAARTVYALNHKVPPSGDIKKIKAWEIPDHDLLTGLDVLYDAYCTQACGQYIYINK